MDWPRPRTCKDIQIFLGFANYLRDYCPHYATVAAPLDQLRHSTSVDVLWDSSDIYQLSFDTLKALLCNAAQLSFMDPDLPLICATDASKFGVGAVLFQIDADGNRRYITFISKALNKAQLNYSATRRELLAIVFAFQRLHHFLAGRHFELWTDHQALTFWKKQEVPSAVILDWLDILSSYDFDVRHCPGVLMVLPDGLSRMYPASFWNPRDPSSDSKRVARMRVDELVLFPERKLAAYVVERFSKTLPPAADRHQLLVETHAVGHFGGEQLFRQLWHSGVWWPRMRRDALKLVSKCDTCLRFNISKKGYHPLRSYKALLPMDQIALDLFSFGLTSPRGINYVLVAFCIATRYHWLIALTDKRAITVARALFSHIIARFGAPAAISSDQGKEFVNEVVSALSELFGVSHFLVAAYNPRASYAESAVKTAKNVIQKMTGGLTKNFDLYLSSSEYALNFAHCGRGTDSLPAALMFARAPNRLADVKAVSEDAEVSEKKIKRQAREAANILYPSVAARADTEHARASKEHHDKRRVVDKTLPPGSTVMIRDVRWTKKQMEPRYLGPFEVVDRKGNSYRLVDKITRAALKRMVPIDQIKLVERPLLLPDPAALEGSPDLPSPSAEDVDDPRILFEASSLAAQPTPATPSRKSQSAPAHKTAADPLPSPKPQSASAPKSAADPEPSPAPIPTAKRGRPAKERYLPGVYQVEDIVGMRRAKSAGGGGGRPPMEFLVRWQGFPREVDNTWELGDNLPQHLVEGYQADQRKAVPASPQRRGRRKR